ncbi:MAG: L-asparaginase / beta-aspartyl-peptidase [Candidatus Binatota bacterium]|jgi:beta-aspartyl-peptidase (threonine type)|nr:L-asparaginase / beta-aspartyl-peptidase [Candidatus Binatota bacterium]
MPQRFNPAIIVHGGAGPIRDDSLAARLAGCKEAALAGWQILTQGGNSLDAVEAAVVALEDNPLFNAGTGSTLNSLGKVEMDAAIMEGTTLRAGAVAAVSEIKNPIKLARRVMEDGRHLLLAGDGALSFARQIGFPECAPESLIVDSERRRWESKNGTVGCVAFDRTGGLAVATSTGGIFNKLPGRIGDSPLIGCGTYADDAGAVSCTGYGEAIIRVVMAKTTVELLKGGAEPSFAAGQALDLLAAKTGSTAGLILIDRNGNIGYARNALHMPICAISGAGQIVLES